MKLKNIHVYVVESPLQALCALEVRLENPLAEHHVFFRQFGEEREKNDEQIKEILATTNWAFSEEVRLEGTGIRKHINVRRLLSKFRSMYSKDNTFLFLGEFRAEWMHLIKAAIRPKRTTFLDDGAASIYVIQAFFAKSIFYPISLWNYSWKSRLRYLFFLGFMKQDELGKPSTVLTLFHGFPESEYLQHLDLTYVLKINSEKNKKYKKEVYYFGSKYSEAGVLGLTDELGFLQAVYNYYKERGHKEISYIPHRDESSKKLDYVSEVIGFKINSFKQLAELELMKRSDLPNEVAGAYSTVLNSVKTTFPNIRVTSFRIPASVINEKHINNIDLVYKYFLDTGISVVEL